MSPTLPHICLSSYPSLDPPCLLSAPIISLCLYHTKKKLVINEFVFCFLQQARLDDDKLDSINICSLMVWNSVLEYAVETHREIFVKTYVPNIHS